MIPTQLQKTEFRFIKLREKDKVPFEPNWQNTANYAFDNESLLKWISQGGNYGVLGGYGHLAIIDCDAEAVVQLVEKNLPKTFTVKTGRGGRHFYYICKDLDSPIRLREKSSKIVGDIGDVQSKGKQVVGAGSIHPNGNSYDIISNMPLAEITAEQIRFALSKYIKTDIEEHSSEERKIQRSNRLEINITDVCSLTGLKKQGDEYQGSHPIHGSDTGVNFMVNPSKNLWHCFRHGTGGGALSWFAVREGIIDCSDATPGCLHGAKFKEVLTQLQSQGLINPSTIENTRNLESQILFALSTHQENEATELIVKDIESKFKIYTTKDDLKPEIWIYAGGIYVPNGRTWIQEQVRLMLKEAYTPQRANKIIAKIETDTYIETTDFFETKYIDEIPVQNGILNLVTGELQHFTPNKIFFNKLPMAFNPDAKCPNIIKFLTDIFGEEDLPTIIEKIGYCLWKEHFIEKATMLVGDGRNGKSKFLSLIKAFLGAENCAAIPLSQLVPDSSGVCELHNKLVNLAGDLSKTSLKETGLFKEIIGRDMISAKRKYLRDLFFVNYSKQFFACNELPFVYDMSFGFWSRWDLFTLKNTFVSKIEYDKNPDKKNLAIADTDIIQKITSSEELSGLLNEALLGLQRLLKNKKFSVTRGVEETKKEWIRKSNSILGFCNEYIESCAGEEYITKRDFRQAYQSYCKKNKLIVRSDKHIKYILENSFGASEVRQNTTFNDFNYCWVGIRFNSVNKKTIDCDDCQDYYLFPRSHGISNSMTLAERVVILQSPSSVTTENSNSFKVKHEKTSNCLVTKDKNTPLDSDKNKLVPVLNSDNFHDNDESPKALVISILFKAKESNKKISRTELKEALAQMQNNLNAKALASEPALLDSMISTLLKEGLIFEPRKGEYILM